MKKYIFFLFCLFDFYLFSQDIRISYTGSRNYYMVERTDLRRYDNGKYRGLLNREVRSFISPVSYNSDFVYEGNFFVEQETKRNTNNVGFGFHEAIPSKFEISSNGSFKMIEDNGYPSFRSFPTYTDQKLKKGDSWTAKAERSVDPLNKGIPTKMPIYVQYTFVEEQIYHDEPVYFITAQWATRYGVGSGTSYIDYDGDDSLKKATGSHKANILVNKITGATLVIRDTVDEVFVYTDGNQIQLKGTISMFIEYPPAIDKEKLLPALQRVAKLQEQPEKNKNITDKDGLKNSVSDINKHKNSSVQYESTPAGIRLTLFDLQFKPDSSELLPGEETHLIEICEVLKQAPESHFLIEGHTAQTGNTKGEMSLSIERAKAIAAIMAKHGIPEEKFICKGSGGTKPIAPNSTPEGKSKNRRVEITILE